MARRALQTALVALLLTGSTGALAAERVKVGPGVVRPLYAPSPEEATVPVAAFRLDRTQVTNAQYLAFVRANPRWQKGQVPRLFADEGYLAHWAGPARLGSRAPANAPVVRVSWFAAKAYCESRGARLPTEAQWELAAQATATQPDGSRDPAFVAEILGWYARPTPAVLPSVGRGQPNYWGAQDLHGLVWEWVLDFANASVSSDSRNGRDGETLSFCGAGSLTASNKDDYAAFMRLAFRSSLQASYTTGNLGFRCAWPAEGAL